MTRTPTKTELKISSRLALENRHRSAITKAARIMEVRSWNQRRMAEELGVDAPYWSRWRKREYKACKGTRAYDVLTQIEQMPEVVVIDRATTSIPAGTAPEDAACYKMHALAMLLVEQNSHPATMLNECLAWVSVAKNRDNAMCSRMAANQLGPILSATQKPEFASLDRALREQALLWAHEVLEAGMAQASACDDETVEGKLWNYCGAIEVRCALASDEHAVDVLASGFDKLARSLELARTPRSRHWHNLLRCLEAALTLDAPDAARQVDRFARLAHAQHVATGEGDAGSCRAALRELSLPVAGAAFEASAGPGAASPFARLRTLGGLGVILLCSLLASPAGAVRAEDTRLAHVDDWELSLFDDGLARAAKPDRTT